MVHGTIADSVSSIGKYAFSDCTSLKEIVIPDSVTSISDCVFMNSTSLTIYCVAESQPNGWSYRWNDTVLGDLPIVVWGYTGNK